MVAKKTNKKTPKKYTTRYDYKNKEWKQQPVPRHHLKRDNQRAAKRPGWRPVYNSQGKIDHYYFERRANRSDTKEQVPYHLRGGKTKRACKRKGKK